MSRFHRIALLAVALMFGATSTGHAADSLEECQLANMNGLANCCDWDDYPDSMCWDSYWITDDLCEQEFAE